MYYRGSGVGHRSARQASAQIRVQENLARYQLASGDSDEDEMEMDPVNGDGDAWEEDPEEIDILAYPSGKSAARTDPEVDPDELDDYGYNATPYGSDDENAPLNEDEDDEAILGPEDGEDPMLDDYEDYGFADL